MNDEIKDIITTLRQFLSWRSGASDIKPDYNKIEICLDVSIKFLEYSLPNIQYQKDILERIKSYSAWIHGEIEDFEIQCGLDLDALIKLLHHHSAKFTDFKKSQDKEKLIKEEETDEIKELIERLKLFNKWRRGEDDEVIMQPDSKQLGIDLDTAIRLLESYESLYKTLKMYLVDGE